ncbi:hypothetical protein JXJ21_17060 [candidate division KSB1 bacterium]|nr:hypothetical protein [candidate division KSB1 bacterium]
MQKYILLAVVLVLFFSCSGYRSRNIFNDTNEETVDSKIAQPFGEPLYQALDRLTNQLVSEMDERNKKSVAVGQFLNLDGSLMMFGRFISEKLISKLFETKRFRVIERSRLDQVLDEIQLSQLGVIEPDLAKRLGKLLGAEAIVTGTITDLGDGFDINARIVDTQTGDVFAAATTIIAKDETVYRILQYGYVSGPQPNYGETATSGKERKPQPGAFKSAVEIDTKVLVDLKPVYEYGRKKFDLELLGDCLIWKNFGKKNHIGYLHRNGKIILLSENALESQNDMDIFRNEYVTISNCIMKVNVNMDKAIRNQAWKRHLTVYNYERNTYKRIIGYLKGKAIISVPRLTIKQASLFVYADGWNNRIFIENDLLARWENAGSRQLDVTKFMYFGDHHFEIKQYGGSRPFFILQFFVESSPESINLTNNADLNIRDSVNCYAIDQLVLP